MSSDINDYLGVNNLDTIAMKFINSYFLLESIKV